MQQNSNDIKTIQISNGETIAYREAGNSSNILLMVHGSLTSSFVFKEHLPILGETFRVLALDLPGNGHSSYKNLLKSIDDYAEVIKQFADSLNLTKFNIFGWSAGGASALKFAAKYPDYVDKIVISNPLGIKGAPIFKVDQTGKPTQERAKTDEDVLSHPFAQSIKTAIQQKDKEKVKPLIGLFIFSGKTKPSEEKLESYLEDWFLSRSADRILILLNGFNISNEHNGANQGTNEVVQIKSKVLILQGGKDSVVPNTDIEELQKNLKVETQVKVFPESGHAVFEDDPVEFIDSIKQFCA